MGRVAEVISFVRKIRGTARVSEVQIRRAENQLITADHYADPGDDSFPLTTDFTQSVSANGEDRANNVAYADPINDPRAIEGDKRIYGRDPETGAWVNEVWLHSDSSVSVLNSNGSFTLNADGSIVGVNASGKFELEVGGDFVANGAKMKTNGDVVTSDGVSLRNHTHAQLVDSNGNVQVETNPPTATE